MRKHIQLFVGLVISILMAVVMSSCGSSRKTMVVEEGWEKLGERKVNFVRDRDEIDITSETKYTAVVFMVRDGDVHLNDVEIHFTNGDRLTPLLDDDISQDQYSRVVEIDREGKLIDKVAFKYRSTGNLLKGRASVIVLGKRADRF